MRALAAGLAIVLAVAPAAAQHMDKALFLELATGSDREQQALLLVYLRGVLNGLEAANMELRRYGRARLFCAPDEPPLEADWLVDELVNYLQRYPAVPDTASISVIANFALQESYPCERPVKGDGESQGPR